MASKKIQLYTDRDKTIEASPETSANCVILSDGNDLQKVLDNDLTTPTVVHEETSFKVGVGDVNVSSSVVDGESSKVVIKGKTYQNILPEPSLRNSMTNGKSMQKLNEGYENVNVVDGVAKSAILKGNTLVNLNNGQRNETLDSTIGNGSSRTYACKIPYTIPSGTYITFKLKTNTINGITGNLKAHFKQNAATTTTGDRYPTLRNYNSHPTGEYYINVCHQTPIDLEAINLYIDDNVGVIDVSDVMILIGDYTNVDIPYFEGMQSVRMPVLTTTGKNLCGEINKNATFIWAKSYEWENDVLKLTLNDGGYNAVRFPIRLSKGNYHLSASHNGHAIGFRVINDSGSRMVNPITLTKDEEVLVEFMGNGGDVEENKIITFSNIQLEQNTTQTPYEPHKTNILSTPSDLELRGIGDVKDTLDCLTGELTQRIGEVVLDGGENWVYEPTYTNDNVYGCYIGFEQLPQKPKPNNFNFANNMFPNITNNSYSQEGFATNPAVLSLRINKNKLDSNDVSGFKKYLQNHPITLQYPLATESIKTVDLSSYGNWNKVTLNGSENGWGVSFTDWKNKVFCLTNAYLPNVVIPTDISVAYVMCDKLKGRSIDWLCGELGRTGVALHHWFEDYLQIAIDGVNTIDELKQYLSENPITVWYPTKTQQENSITEMLSFNDGHIKLSSEEGSLIPSLDYEVPTSNSYHMDLMKANTIYTMKLSTGNGSLVAHNGQTIGYMTNRTFDSGQLPINNLFYTTGWVNDLMILEGDVTSKSLPYFKGIRSAFEDESKIEVLSTGKNIFNKELELGGYDNTGAPYPSDSRVRTKQKTYLTKGEYFITCSNAEKIAIDKWNIGGTFERESVIVGASGTFTTQSDCYINLTCFSSDLLNCIIQIEQSSILSAYEPYKSNSTKIPLLSPLRSLPNGVCDELIIDRMKKKATLIQRVGHTILGQGDSWGAYEVVGDTMKVGRSILPDVKPNGQGMSTLIPYTFNSVSQPNEGVYIYRHASSSEVRVRLKLKRTGRHDAVGMQNWLRSNNIVTLYELETPIITEIDLENFPLVYKDGHIFLNSEIAPVVEIDYNVNQAQQIQANNETLQRHELDILDLDNLIVSFVNAEYNLRLLKFDMELSMMALAE